MEKFMASLCLDVYIVIEDNPSLQSKRLAR